MPTRLLSGIEITDLHGVSHVSLKSPSRLNGPNLLIIQGPNGCGKTTVLRFIASVFRYGHSVEARTNIQQLVFTRAKIFFQDNCTVALEKSSSGILFEVTIDGNLDNDIHDYSADSTIQSAQVYNIRKSLSRFNTDVEYISDTRNNPFYSSKPHVFADLSSTWRKKLAPNLPNPFSIDQESESPDTPISQAIEKVHSWVRSQTLEATDSGNNRMHSHYIQVINNLIQRDSKSKSTASNDYLKKLIEDVFNKDSELESYGLASKLDVDSILEALRGGKNNPTLRAAIIQILVPYIESIQERQKSLSLVSESIRTLVDEVNSFLEGKTLSYHLSTGISLHNNFGAAIKPDNLSSGEKQLVLLMCNALLARKSEKIFIIDEPEISLNFSWLRKLMPSILNCIGGGDSQVVIATHSIEILADYHDFVADIQVS